MNPDAHPDREPLERPRRQLHPTSGEPVPTVGGHDPQPTAALLARQLDELARALNHATRVAGPRLECAPDVYDVLGSLGAALTKLPQACGQLADFLARQNAGGRLRAERGFPHAGHPTVAVETATFKLGQAAVAANVAAVALGRAQEAVSGLSQVELDRPPACARQTPWASTTDRVAPDRGPVIEP